MLILNTVSKYSAIRKREWITTLQPQHAPLLSEADQWMEMRYKKHSAVHVITSQFYLYRLIQESYLHSWKYRGAHPPLDLELISDAAFVSISIAIISLRKLMKTKFVFKVKLWIHAPSIVTYWRIFQIMRRITSSQYEQ